jgi:hypothetical protein|tara:strand:+ start:438 stop:623 length:186 start_codon:yes stop_codon:yes gene_type:complete
MAKERTIKFDKNGKPIIKDKNIDPKLLKMLKDANKGMNRKANGGTIDMSRGQAGYNFKGIF